MSRTRESWDKGEQDLFRQCLEPTISQAGDGGSTGLSDELICGRWVEKL